VANSVLTSAAKRTIASPQAVRQAFPGDSRHQLRRSCALGKGKATSCVGDYVWMMLQEPNFTAHVLVSFSRAFYFVGNCGELAWVGQSDQPAHRRAILTPFSMPEVRTGDRMSLAGDRLILEGGGTVSLHSTRLWSTNHMGPQPQRLLCRQDLQAAVPGYLRCISELPNRRGLGNALELVLGARGGRSSAVETALEQALWRVAYEPVCDVIDACRGADGAHILVAGEKLIGLGPGLTPSGDDYLGGLLFIAHHLRQAYGGGISPGSSQEMGFLDHARTKTNRISFTILGDLCTGHGPEPLHTLVLSMLSGEHPMRVRSIAERLTQIGSTTGWDMLAGALTGMLQVLERDVN